MKELNDKQTLRMISLVSLLIVVIVVLSTFWMGYVARQATKDSVREVSMMYMDELAGRRAQVISTHLQNNIDNMETAISLMTHEDLSDVEHLQRFQLRMRKLYDLEKFAFVDEKGQIYTALGMEYDIDEYPFDYKTLTDPVIAVKEEGGANKVIIAVPVDHLQEERNELVAAFMEIDMETMLNSLALQQDVNETTFCNIYTQEGKPLTNMVLGGLSKEDNLLTAMKEADYEKGYSFNKMVSEFSAGKSGLVSFTYGGIQETLDYVPIDNTDWMLTYLIRESVISDRISDITNRTTMASFFQTVIISIIMLLILFFVLQQVRRNSLMQLEKDKMETENRVQKEEMEKRLSLQAELLEQEKKRAQQDKMITAMAADYRSVYYVDLDENEGICYRSEKPEYDICSNGDHFDFSKEFAEYCDKYVAPDDKEDFMKFIDLDTIRDRLTTQNIIIHRYLTVRDGKESYEMLRMAGVRHVQDRDDHIVHAVGVGFTDVDEEMREEMALNHALTDALSAAEDASKAKTVFLSNMSHEIRTPMNAIIGLDTIALSDPDISDETRDRLEKIDSSAHHLLGLINDILDISRIESGKLTLRNEEFSFPQIIEQVNTLISAQAQDKGLTYECDVQGDIGDYYIGDDMKLKQVIINILGNAVKFTDEGGSVKFTVEKTGAFDGKTSFRFTMSDTGAGMDESFIPQLFQPFTQENSGKSNKYGSTGLGMAITKSIVEMMNGSIDVKSKKGEGTTFIVQVTLMDSDRESDGSETKFDPASMTVLVIDDDQVARDHATVVLQSMGIQCETAESGQKALDMINVREARQDPYNMILVDLRMPEMDGIETTRRIRQIADHESAVVILTAYNWEDVQEEAAEAGVDSFIAKPLFASSVIEKFQAAMSAKAKHAKEASEKVELAGRHVLLAEDMMVNAEIMMELLSMKEIECDHAENGRICVDMFSKSAEGYYDVILMDMRMPEMDGLEATKAIRAMDREDAKNIPIIALTANAFDEDVQKSLQAGLNAHLSKPVEPDSLFETMENLLK